MQYREAIGNWRIDANGYVGTLQLWMAGRAPAGRLWLDAHQVWEALTAVGFNTNTDDLAFTRGIQQYIGKLAFDTLRGQVVDGGSSHPWHAERAWPAETRLESTRPRVRFLTARPGAPTSPRVLVLVEERLPGPLLAAFDVGSSLFSRWLDDLQNEGWDACAYTYDVRSDETGEPGHRHLPSEVLQLYRYIREFYFTAGTRLSGVVLVGDFPAAGICSIHEWDVDGTLNQGELDHFCVDAMLADPFGYWEWLPVAPMVPPGSPKVLRSPYDEVRPPNFALYPRTQWSAPGFVLTRQSEMHHSQRDPNRHDVDPKYWIARISASQAAWRTGPLGWEWSETEEIRLLMDFFNRNHAHRSGNRSITNGYICITEAGLASWQAEKNKMGAIIPQQDIVVNANDPALPTNERANIANYIASFQQEYLVCEFVSHSNWLNHIFPHGQDGFPTSFPNRFRSPGSNFRVSLLPANTIKASHLIAVPNKAPTSRFYLLGGCDVGAIISRPQNMTDDEHVSPATPLHRQYGAQVLAVAYLMHANGLVVLAHNVTNPAGDYTPIYQAWKEGKSLGEGVIKLMQNENDRQKSAYTHYRNVIFGDPTLKLSYG